MARFLILTSALLFCLVASANAQTVQTGNGWGKGGNPKPTPSPSPSGSDPLWLGTHGTDWNNKNNWDSGSIPTSATDTTFQQTGTSSFTPTIGMGASGSALSLQFANDFTTNSFNITGLGTLNIFGGGINDTSTNTTQTISVTTVALNASQTWTVAGGGTLSVSSAVNSAASSGTTTLTLAGSGSKSISGVISNGGGTNTVALSVSAGTATLTGANTYTGATTISSGSTLQLGSGGTTGSLSATSTITDSGTFTINRSNSATQGTDFSSSAITGTGGITQAGSGATTLTAANSYTGATTVNGGTLFINGNQTSATGTTTVNNSGTVLGGSGTIGGAVNIASSGAILEGGTGSTGQTLTIKGSLTQVSGSIIELALGSSLAHSTLALTSASASSFYSTQKFTFIELAGVTTGTYTDIVTGVTSDPNVSNWTITNAGWTGSFFYDSSDNGIDLILTKVPEPSTYAAGTLACLVVGYAIRRRFARRHASA